MKKIMISLLAVLLLTTTGAATVFADGNTNEPECVGEECEVKPHWIPCEWMEPDCMDLD